MTVESHLAELQRKHRALDEAISTERTQPASDPLRMTELKRRKLLLKDEIALLRARPSRSRALH